MTDTSCPVCRERAPLGGARSALQPKRYRGVMTFSLAPFFIRNSPRAENRAGVAVDGGSGDAATMMPVMGISLSKLLTSAALAARAPP